MKLDLPVDLVTINCNNIEDGKKALEYSSKFIEFNNIYYFTDAEIEGNFEIVKINKIDHIKDYNNFILKLKNYVKSPYVLVVQDDGHVLNPNIWTDEFLKYDYIGAPWPASKKWNKRWDRYGKNYSKKIKYHSKFNRIGNGGFSLRSKKFLEYSTQFNFTEILAEDIFLTLYNYDKAKDYGINFPSVETALKFSYETPLRGKNLKKEKNGIDLDTKLHFGWHGKKFKNSDYLLDLKNEKNKN